MWAKPQLQPKHITCPSTEKDIGMFEATVLLRYVLQKDELWIATNSSFRLTTKQINTFKKIVHLRTKHKPIAYILGEKEFYGYLFSVNKSTLIPRPETETLIDSAIEIISQSHLSEPLVWDIGTGSGAIAITLAKKIPRAQILATDTSKRALQTAQKNATSHQIQSRITFLQQNLLQPKAYKWLLAHQSSDKQVIICANLPYLPESDKTKLAPDITEYEPKSALYSGKDGLALIFRLLGQIARHYNEWKYDSIYILLEFDPPQITQLYAQIKKLFPKATITFKQDLAKRDRICLIQLF